MKRDSWTVGDHAVRPFGPPGRCFYCDVKVGQQHKPDCVIRSRTVVVQATVELTIDVPEGWTQDDVNFRYNESSWCANNLVEELQAMLKRKKKHDGRCMCSQVRVDYIREAVDADESTSALFARKLLS